MEAKQDMSFEQKIEKAKELLELLIQPDITLSQSVKVYKNGLKELQEAQQLLDEAKLHYINIDENTQQG